MKLNPVALLAIVGGAILFAVSDTFNDDTNIDAEGNYMPPDETAGYIEQWAEAIKKFEGWFTGSRSQKNNNPGNLKGGSWSGVIGKDDTGLLIFDSYDNGWAALLTQLTVAAKGQSHVYYPTMTLIDFFRKYAPSSDSNNPVQYAQFVAAEMGLDPNTEIGTLA